MKEGRFYISDSVKTAIYTHKEGITKIYFLNNEKYAEIRDQFVFLPLTIDVLNDSEKNERTIEIVNIELTNFCNLQCSHCYASMSRSQGSWIDKNQFSKILFELKNLDIPIDIKLSGGEPSLNANVVDFCEKVFCIRPITNHTLISNLTMEFDILLSILRTGINLQVSCYGFSYNDYHSFCYGDEHQFVSFYHNICSVPDILKKQIVLILFNIGEDKLKESVKFAKKLGYNYIISGFQQIGRAFSNKKTSIDNNTLVQYSQKVHLSNRICENNKLCIFTNGDVSPCPFYRNTNPEYVFGNLYREPIKDILQNPRFAHFDSITIDDVDECKCCPLKYICTGGCSAETLYAKKSRLKRYPWCKYEDQICMLDTGKVYEVQKIKPGYFSFTPINIQEII